MSQFRVKTSSILENHLPGYVREDYPLFIQFFKKYYESIESKGSSKDLIENIDQYVNLDTVARAVESTSLSSNIEAYVNDIAVDSVKGFPDTSGLIQIDSEIIFYGKRNKETNTFEECVRGFSGRVEKENGVDGEIVFESSFASNHTSGSDVKNLSVLFLKIFLKKLKTQYIPGFEDREFNSKLNQATFIKQARDFYSTKGTPESFRILFKSLYGVEAEITNPSDFILEASSARNRIDNVIVVESLFGDIYKLENKTLYQDQYENIKKAFGTINDIVKISEDNREYYILSLDNDVQRDVSLGQGGTFGEFTVHASTQCISDISVNSSTIDVDSTLSFPDSGTAYINLGEASSDLDIVFTYTSKTTTQFRGCTGIFRFIPRGSKIRIDTFAYGYGDDVEDRVTVRVTGILSQFKYPDVDGMSKDDTVEISSLGSNDEDDFRTNNWIFNNSIRCKVKEIRNLSGFSYEVITYDPINVLNGDQLLINAIIKTRDGRLENINRVFDADPGSDPTKSFKITNDAEIVTIYTAQRQIRKVPSLDYNADITNTYIDTDRNTTYVVAPSLPHYYNQNLSLKTRIIKFDANVDSQDTITATNHGFLTGDAIVYKPAGDNNTLNIIEGIYFAQKVDNNRLKIAKSRSDIFKNDFISLTGICTASTLAPLKFVDRFLNIKEIQSQKLVRKFSEVELTENKYETLSGPIGLFVNGVEVLNHKSEDVIKYGLIENAVVSAPGSGYDVINPPEVQITDEVGVGASAYLRVTGSLDRIDIVDPGLDYVNEPFISISGGNGFGARAQASMASYKHSITLNATSGAFRVGLEDSSITFKNNHQFKDGEKIIYKTQGGSPIGGLVNNSIYYVSIIGSKKIRLHNNLESALKSTPSYDNIEVGYLPPVENSWIVFSSFGTGNHILESYDYRKKISSIRILSSGENYSNRKNTFTSENVDIYSNTFNIVDHGYETGDIVEYTSDSLVGGLTAKESYYIARLDQNSFRLSEIAESPLKKEYYLENNYRVDLTSTGSGSFNYPDIKVEIDGTIGISSIYFTGIVTSATLNSTTPNVIGINTTGIKVGHRVNQFNGYISQNTQVTSVGIGTIGISTAHLISAGISTQSVVFSEFIDNAANIIPVFRGEVHSVKVSSNGVDFGSEDILNYDRQPQFTLKQGKEARAISVISEGKIKEVLVQNTGSDYSSQPNIEVLGDGVGAQLTPNIVNGRIESITVITQGNGYKQDNTRIIITPSGVGFKGNARIKQWTINNFQRFLRSDQISDDGGIIRSGRYGLQYSHIYPPTNLRDNVYGKVDDGVTIRYQSDLLNDTSGFTYHSPIIGWAYDGNPIYGPYGYENASLGGSVVQMKSGYELERSANRPPSFPLGFFIEDYVFRNVGTLDEHNGRFCKTPEFPNGTYAYFTTFSENILDNGPFSGQKRPEFPYVIGNSYRSLPIEFNYDRTSTEDLFSFDNLIRNTYHYNLNSDNSDYPFIVNSSKIRKQTTDVKASSSGSVDSIEIISGGDNYKIGDTLLFGEEKTDGGFGAYAFVSQIGGETVTTLSTRKTNIANVEVIPSIQTNNQYLFISKEPHGFNNFEDISITGINTDAVILKNNYNIRVPQHQLQLKVGVGTVLATGLTTSFEVSGKLSEQDLFVNDQFTIGTEVVKVLEIDQVNSIIRVRRSINGTDGDYSAGEFLVEKPRKFAVSDSVAEYVFEREKEYYFDPRLSVGFGTVGINTTIFLNTVDHQFSASVGVGTSTRIFFDNPQSILKFSGGGYANLANSTDSDFDVIKSEIISVGSTSITINFDTSSLSGVGVTVFVDKWNIATPKLKSIYLPNHKFVTGQSVKYNSYVGSGLSVSNDTFDIFGLENDQTVYVAKIDNNFIGIATNPIGISTTGEEFVGIGTTTGLLYFVGVGTETIHSFKTIPNRPILTDVEQKLVTVSTNNNPSLNVGDRVIVESTPSIKKTIKLIYDDSTRRVLTKDKFFTPSAINISNNTITLNDHGYYNGEKVILKTSSSGNGIENNQLFYVVTIDLNTIKLSTLFNNRNDHIANITAQFPGTLYSVNPQINLTRGQTLSFDLSDESLSYESGSERESAFTFDVYTDRTFKTLFKSSQATEIFELTSYGEIGIDENARLEIFGSDTLPKYLYYKLNHSLNTNLPTEKREIIIDDENNPTHNLILKEESVYSGTKTVVGITPTSFNYTLVTNPEQNDYTNISQGSFKYKTTSKLPSGPIEKVTLGGRGKNYRRLPYIDSIKTASGTNALLFPKSNTIGKILKTRLNDPGYDYPSDKTLSPQAKLPQIIKLDPLASFVSIEIANQGVNYSSAPNIVVKDGFTGKVIDNLNLRYEFGDNFVTIDKNTTGIYDVDPIFIPTNNGNGVPIKNIEYDFDTQLVTIFLSVSYSDAARFPFAVGDTVLVENTSTITNFGFSNRGYNSSGYNYELFELISTDPNIGGSNASIVYSLKNYLSETQSPGNFNPSNSIGKVLPSKYFPKFKANLKKNNFFTGEIIKVNNRTINGQDITGVIEYWDLENQYMKVSSKYRFRKSTTIRGVSSNSQAVIQSSEQYNGYYDVQSSTLFERGWDNRKGFLNDSLQRLHDNDYYQYLSYAVKSPISMDRWDDAVSTLNHPVGFKKFSDLSIDSRAATTGIATVQDFGNFVSKVDIDTFVSTQHHYDFDNITENSVTIDGRNISEQIEFKSTIIQDYAKSIGNKVLVIDNISQEFNSDPRLAKFSIVNTFRLDEFRSRKYILTIKDKRFAGEKEVLLATLLHDGGETYLNQYGSVNTAADLGTFDTQVFGEQGRLLFYPTKFQFNDYDTSFVSFDIRDTIESGQLALGDCISINESGISATGISTIFEKTTDHKASKILVQYKTEDGFEFDELSLLNDGTSIELLEYGQLTNIPSSTSNSSLGFGTYHAHIDGGSVKIEFHPNDPSLEYDCNLVSINLNPSLSGIGSTELNTGVISSHQTGITSTSSPSANVVAQYTNTHNGSYIFALVEDVTNAKTRLSEIVVASESTTSDITEFATISTSTDNLGTFSVDSDGTTTTIKFTPLENIETNVVIFQTAVKNPTTFYNITNIDI
jgi:hypothetical protein